MLPNVLPLEASHSSLDIFERSLVLITFDSSFEQKMVRFFHPMGRRLNLRLLVIETTFWTCKKNLEIKCKVTQTDGTDLRYDGTSAANSDNPIFVNNTLHSLFSECTVTAN